jgi:predicted Zn-dependent protease
MELSPSERFTQIGKEIDANCGECYGASKYAFVRAVTELEKLVAEGFEKPAAKRLLADSYQTWAFVYVKSGSQEASALLGKARNIYRELTEQTPNDPDAWAAYALSLEDPRASLEPLRRAESLAPRDPYLKFLFGMLYAHGLGDLKTGANYLEQAVDLEENYPKLEYLEQLARVYELTGDSAKATKIRGEMKLFEQELEAKDRLRQQKTDPTKPSDPTQYGTRPETN